MTSARPIPSLNGLYEATPGGEIRRVGGSPLKPCVAGNGYARVYPCINGKVLTRTVHRLVAEAFHGPIPDKHVICHLNHVRADNRLENLVIATQAENIQQSVREGRPVGKGRPPLKKLKTHQLQEIVDRYASGGVKQSELAATYGVSQSMISKVIRTNA